MILTAQRRAGRQRKNFERHESAETLTQTLQFKRVGLKRVAEPGDAQDHGDGRFT